MMEIRDGRLAHQLSGSGNEIALAHAIGMAFIELQKLEFAVISYLEVLAGDTMDANASFELFGSKTFGNLLAEMRKHALLVKLADDLRHAKERRDFLFTNFYSIDTEVNYSQATPNMRV
jgi:hypothetical protein